MLSNRTLSCENTGLSHVGRKLRKRTLMGNKRQNHFSALWVSTAVEKNDESNSYVSLHWRKACISIFPHAVWGRHELGTVPRAKLRLGSLSTMQTQKFCSGRYLGWAWGWRGSGHYLWTLKFGKGILFKSHSRPVRWTWPFWAPAHTAHIHTDT